ncbi:transposase [Kibdelosporangium lantanae]|uniref:Transposase n=1 Tax=Kibdelosporangium lantanae TaxID=1497396 RepID=A0ABW3M2W7_9PSEU
MSGLLPVRISGPLAEPAVRLSAQQALHGMQPMAERLGVDHQQLQQFVSTSTWDHVEVRRRLAVWAREFVDLRALVIDDTGFPKDGKDSPGMARMYGGALGKSLFLSLVSGWGPWVVR